MRVLIADKLPAPALERLKGEGAEPVYEPSLRDTALTEALTRIQPVALVVRSTKVRPEHLRAAPGLQLIVRAGAGVNTIDVAAASARGVFVANCPGMNAVAVAELCFAHMLNADRRLADNVAELRAGRWRKKHFAAARGLKGRSLGVLGCGSIGRAVIARAQAFEMRVRAWSPSLDDAGAEALGVTRCASPLEVAQGADVLSVHLALKPQTRGLIDATLLAALPEGALLINTSRGGLVDEAALAHAVQSRGLRAGLDVFCDEPGADGPWACDLAQLEGVYGSHHIGASTEQAQQAVADAACDILLEWRRSGEVRNCVNLARHTPASHLLIVRHADEVGVLATVLGTLREATINVQQMQNLIFDGAGHAACARIQLERAPGQGVLDALQGAESIYDVSVIEL